MIRTRRNVLLIAVAVVAVGLACDSSESEAFYSASITLVNNGTQDVHLLAPGESMSEANRVAPGGSRSVTVTYSSLGGSAFTFRAERPEGQLGQTSCIAGRTLLSGSVVWTGSAMTCQGW